MHIYPLPFFRGRKGQAQKGEALESAGFEPIQETDSLVRQNLWINRCSANISLLDSWQISTMLRHRWVLSYPDAFSVGNPGQARCTREPQECQGDDPPTVGNLNGKARRNSSVQQLTFGRHLFPRKTLTLFICRYSRKAGQYS